MQGWKPGDAGSGSKRFPAGNALRQVLLDSLATRVMYVFLVFLFVGGCQTGRRTSNPSQMPAATQPDSSSTLEIVHGRLENWQSQQYHNFKPSNSLIQHSFSQEGGDSDPVISPDGKWMVFSSMRHSPNPDILVKRVYGQTVTLLTSDPASEMQPVFSPLGDKVAYATNRSGNWDIWIVGVDGANPIKMTQSSSHEIHPCWSPDGKRIVYSSTGSRSQQWEIWVLHVDNPSIKKMIGYGLNPVWSPNPKIPKIAYQVARSRGSQWFSIWTMDYVDEEAKFPTEIINSYEYACVCPAWSPDGTKLAYAAVKHAQDKNNNQVELSAAESGEAIYVIDLDGTNNLRLTQEDATHFSPTWSAEGRVFFCSDRKGIDNIWSVKPHQMDLKRETPLDLSEHPLNGFRAN